MNIKKSVFIIGGDSRYVRLAALLAERYRVLAAGFDDKTDFRSGEVELMSMEKMISSEEKPDCIVLPMPPFKETTIINTPLMTEGKIELSQVLELCGENTFVLGGKLDGKTYGVFREHGIRIEDYLEREEFAVANAVPTAEGALQIALEQMPVTIFKSRVLVTGFGRVAKAVQKIFSALGAEVTVSARKHSDFAWAEIYGARPLSVAEMSKELPVYDIVINTVPALLFGQSELEKIRKEALIIDLASKPGGIDFAAADRLQRRVVWALAIPGKTAPKTAAEILGATILTCISESEMR